MRFALQATDYLGSTLAPSPVLHFWSLGVEEQFYVFWPALLALVGGAAFAAGRRETGLRRLAVALGAVFVLSLGLSLWLTNEAQVWAFFSLPARAWELALGGLLALPAAGRFVPRRAAPWLGWGGLAMIVASGLVLDDGTAFPGVAALLPTVGSALVIASGLVAPIVALPAATARSIRETRSPREAAGTPATPALDRVPRPGSLLGLPPLRFLGRISYSLYLWHWPILVLPEAAVGAELPLPLRLLLAAVAVVVAALSQRFVEDPIRHGRFVGLGSRRSLAFAGALSLVIATTALAAGAAAATRLDATGPVIGGSGTDVPLPSADAVVRTPSPAPASSTPSSSTGTGASGGPSPTTTDSAPPPSPTPVPTLPPLQPGPVPADLVPSLAGALNDLPVTYADGCHLDQSSTVPGPCVYGDPASPTTVVLFGDSHAAQWFPALQRLATKHDWRLVSLTKSGCTAAKVTVWDSIDKRPYTECDTWRQNALARIAAEKPELVIVSSSRAFQVMVNGQPDTAADHPDLWTAGLRKTLATLHQSAANVVLIGDTPRSTADPPSCLSQHLSDATACAVSYADAVDAVQVALQAHAASATGTDFIDPTPWVCSTDPCPAVFGRFLVYRDQGHLTATYARGLANELYAALPPIGP
jgi:peptidoglycan/LPS O-acetylase OafA/YrhL